MDSGGVTEIYICIVHEGKNEVQEKGNENRR